MSRNDEIMSPRGVPDPTPRPPVRIPLVRPALPSLAAFASALEPVWESRMLSNFGSQATRFESLAAEYTGAEHGLAVATCDIGLTLAVKALSIPVGSEVLVPSFTFNSTLHALLWNGLRPRFVDVDPDTFGCSVKTISAALTDETALVVGTHVFGVACEVEGIESLCRERGVPCLFDAAQAFGTWIGERHVGTYGDASGFSFSGTKITTSAEGGYVTFAEGEVAERFAALRGYGFQYDYLSRFVGLNGKLSELHATLGVLTVPETEAVVSRRAELDTRYRERLAGESGVRLQRIPAGMRPSFTYFAVDLGERRDEVAEALSDAGIQTKAYFRPLHSMPLFAEFPRGELDVTERLSASLLCLPLYVDLAEHEVDEVVDRVRTVLAG
jgi:dTDP-4-amino-4,6-dideoxygalactose transaminase